MIDPHNVPAEAEAILAALVSFDTTSAKSNTDIISWIEAYLSAHGVTFKRYPGPDGGAEKWNLHAVIGPVRSGGLAFSGHVDCVPVDGQDWSSDPFALREENGRLYGRGAADMKGFVACMLAAVPDIKELTNDEPVHLLFTCDEEITCDGARQIMSDLAADGLLPERCIVGEPSLLAPIVAHKGRFAVRIHFHGTPGHSSNPEAGSNALHAMGRAIALCADEAERLALEGQRVAGFEPPYTTMQVGVASGGSILNIIPEYAFFDVEWRNVPGDEGQAMFESLKAKLAPLEQSLKTQSAQGGIRFEALCNLPPLALPVDHSLTLLTQQITGRNSAGHVSYGTEGGIYQRAGMASIVCGPGDIAQAHKPDEFVTRDQLARCDRMIRDFVKRGAKGHEL
ncbi:acetylornithine deacetylase [Neokomagataea thailandica NBRC 106555]|uniref:Acetylornithine deacetylase n=2 Tax=Neokomagataea TaxID=1223423 RepID=A0A4Y6V9N2_9PROT|nr:MULTISPECIES: acetylornithine deacetylase [Neokomagataea]QDH25638.1 acetylornithine deacetylase [Neokomagataea tanensis]GBR49860.1 acetylornithine deacetylase [Neokomagataea thailandica NBRC 106555]